MVDASTAGGLFGRYRIERQLGIGGMGVVHLATDTQLQRKVALKLVSGRLAGDEEFLRRFHREAEILTQLDSPHIITIFDHGEVDGVPYLAMQYVPAGDLGALLANGALPLAVAAEICAQVAGALAAAHAAGVVHRDVKPANVLLRDPAGEPFAYLSDFGIAKSDGQDPMTRAGDVAGSWEYLSPERTRGEPAGEASDIYALGCLFYACLTGHAPYSGSDVEVAIAHSSQPIPMLEGPGPATARVNAVLARALAKQPEARYASAADFRRDLMELARGGGDHGVSGTAFRAVASTPGSPRRGRKALVAGIAVLALALAGGGLWWGLTQADDAGDRSGPAAIENPVTGDWDNDGHGDVRLSRIWADGAEIKGLPQQLWTAAADASSFEGPVEDMGQRERNTWSGDVDGDGRMDLVEVTESEDERSLQVRTWLGTDEGPAKPRTQRLSVNTEIFTAASYGLGDFDGDGRDDLLVPTQRQDNYLVLAVARSGDDGAFADPVEFSWRGSKRDNTSDLLGIGDLDGDGLDDVYAIRDRNKDGILVRPFLSTGDGFAKQRGTIIDDKVYGTLLSDYVAADVDGDGADELVAMIHMKMDDGFGVGLTVTEFAQGSFVTPRTWAEPTVALESYISPRLAASDVDGDGRDDIVSLDGPDEKTGTLGIVWHRSTGSAFEEPVLVASPECLRPDCREAGFLVRNAG
ncbi:serine/threonine-protein kinase [Nocardioides daejeonensis]|uniref:serine/threonine-protein kinase n=1 Tax=Nocardioides daejeonensis TaxID=1046556 RepID=UPI0013A54B47|nr:serine/threonine-protein kinase [Nocardioides daejeonensis]